MSADESGVRDAVRAEIREFLSTRRARITPEQAGLPNYGRRRRVRGLRREEATLLVGVSDSVVDAITRALRLDDAERAHLLALLRTAGARSRPSRRRTSYATAVRPTSSHCSTR